MIGQTLSMPGKVLVVDSDQPLQAVIQAEQMQRLQSLATITERTPGSESEMTEMISDIDVLIMDSFKITAGIIGAARRLKLIAKTGSGVDMIDTEAATNHGIVVTNAPSLVAVSVSEHAFALMLAVAKKVAVADASVRSGRWREFFDQPPGFELTGKTLGLVGFGAIGSAVGRIARTAFNMDVLVFDPYVRVERLRDVPATAASLDEVLSKSDVVSVHVPLTPETRGLIGRREFAKMKDSSVMINTSRGPVIDEDALIEALSLGRIAGAGLDVLAQEPPKPDCPLLKMSNVVLTPHSAGFIREGPVRVTRACVQGAIDVLEGRLPSPPLNIVNREVVHSLETGELRRTS